MIDNIRTSFFPKILLILKIIFKCRWIYFGLSVWDGREKNWKSTEQFFEAITFLSFNSHNPKVCSCSQSI